MLSKTTLRQARSGSRPDGSRSSVIFFRVQAQLAAINGRVVKFIFPMFDRKSVLLWVNFGRRLTRVVVLRLLNGAGEILCRW